MKKVLKYTKVQTTIKDTQNALKEFYIMHNILASEKLSASTQPRKSKRSTMKTNLKKWQRLRFFVSLKPAILPTLLQMRIDNTLKVRILIDVVHAMKFIHKQNMMHSNLKMESILLNSFFETKLVDFGLISIKEELGIWRIASKRRWFFSIHVARDGIRRK